MMEKLYELMINASKSSIPILCNATKDTSLLNIKSLAKEKVVELYDDSGKRIILGEADELIYEDGAMVQYEDFDDDSGIDMLKLQLKIIDLAKLVEKRIQALEYLEQSRSNKRLQGAEEEKGLEELRKIVRPDFEK